MEFVSPTRRGLLGTVAALGVSPLVASPAYAVDAAATDAPAGPAGQMEASPAAMSRTELLVNGRQVALTIDPGTTLLDALREHSGLTGTKKGCDMGSCGACTVHIDGRRVLSCLTLAARCEGKQITTIEGLADGETPHPVQAAFVEHDALQCGYCTPGQIMSAVALIKEGHAGTDEEIREWMSGNICRCGAYPNIVAAIRDAAGHNVKD